ncbi:phosphoglycolate phosphatase [Actinosynnema sp. ALI-1.44]|uniref:HAD family hydrolase n=1 Tax=Actinosynnema sp. ALI-1.44 TaxID=1933779 RepID=UPI00097BDEBF|nr:HAD family hydrolase [Actinosynnema sp. ALI-1.44]ONI76206.1 phosphoglycolate phosphatase [Actinosynnema sp. ALI-1.44]
MVLRRVDPIPLEKVRAVVFDLDGVLVDSLAAAVRAFEAAYAEVVGPGDAPSDEFVRHAGRYFPDVLHAMGLPSAMAEPYVRESYRLADTVRAHDGVPHLLNVLRGMGIRIAVATGRSRERAVWLLDRLNLLPQIDVVVGSDEVRSPKPAPDIVIEALIRLDVPADAAIMVGGAVADVRSAQAAGVVAAAAVWGESATADLLAARPDLVLRRPSDVHLLCGVDHRTARIISLTG